MTTYASHGLVDQLSESSFFKCINYYIARLLNCRETNEKKNNEKFHLLFQSDPQALKSDHYIWIDAFWGVKHARTYVQTDTTTPPNIMIYF